MDTCRIRLHFSFFLLVALSWVITSCASREFIRQDLFHEDTGTGIHWPPPPQEPRILYKGFIQEPRKRQTGNSWLAKIMSGVFGSEGNTSAMLRPYGVFAGIDRVYVTDPGLGKLHIFDAGEERYFSVKRAGEHDLASPIGIAVDGNGNMYVSDSVLRQVFLFDKEGNYLRSLGSPEMFQRPAGIALADDKLFVVDTHGHKIFVLSQKDGRLLSHIGRKGAEPGNFNFPTNIFVSREGLLYVMDSMNFRVQIFNPDGGFLTSFGKLGDGSGNFSKPKGIAVDSDGHIYVVDAHFDNVQIFDRQGNLLLVFGSSGNGKGEFILPAGIYISSSDRIYVADSYNKRIQMFQYLKEKVEK